MLAVKHRHLLLLQHRGITRKWILYGPVAADIREGARCAWGKSICMQGGTPSACMRREMITRLRSGPWLLADLVIRSMLLAFHCYAM
jgi:hypothetical protein